METAGPRLLPGERVLWRGRPFTGFVLRPSDLFQIPFSLAWSGFAISSSVSAWRTRADLPMTIFAILVASTALYLTIGRFLLDIHLRKHMAYLVTDRRVIIDRQGPWPKTTSLDIRRLPEIEIEERPDGSGTIRFGAAGGWFGPNNFRVRQPALDPTPQFIRIPGIRHVYGLIHQQAGA